jgi:hypothetical protein
MSRNRVKQSTSLTDRLAVWAKGLRDQADLLPPGPERDELIRKTRQADTAAHLDDWADSSGLQPPR